MQGICSVFGSSHKKTAGVRVFSLFPTKSSTFATSLSPSLSKAISVLLSFEVVVLLISLFYKNWKAP